MCEPGVLPQSLGLARPRVRLSLFAEPDGQRRRSIFSTDSFRSYGTRYPTGPLLFQAAEWRGPHGLHNGIIGFPSSVFSPRRTMMIPSSSTAPSCCDSVLVHHAPICLGCRARIMLPEHHNHVSSVCASSECWCRRTACEDGCSPGTQSCKLMARLQAGSKAISDGADSERDTMRTVAGIGKCVLHCFHNGAGGLVSDAKLQLPVRPWRLL